MWLKKCAFKVRFDVGGFCYFIDCFYMEKIDFYRLEQVQKITISSRQSFTMSFILSFILSHSLSHLLLHSLSHSLSHSLFHWELIENSFTNSLSHYFIHYHIHYLIHHFTDNSFTLSLTLENSLSMVTSRSSIDLLERKKRQITFEPILLFQKATISHTSTSSSNGREPNTARPGAIKTTFTFDPCSEFEAFVCSC